MKSCKMNKKQNRIVEKKDGCLTIRIEIQKNMGVEGKVDQDLRKKKQKNKKTKKKIFPPLVHR